MQHPEGSLFINYDQFCAGSLEMNTWFDTYWVNRLETSGFTEVKCVSSYQKFSVVVAVK